MAEELLPSVNLEGVFTEQTFLMVVMWFLLIIGVVIFVFFCVIGIWYLTYRIRIRYYQPVGIDKDGKSILRFIGTDKAKIIKLKGNIYNIRYFWKRKKDEPPPTEAYLPTKKGYEMHVMTNGIDFFPMMLRSNPGFEVVTTTTGDLDALKFWSVSVLEDKVFPPRNCKVCPFDQKCKNWNGWAQRDEKG